MKLSNATLSGRNRWVRREWNVYRVQSVDQFIIVNIVGSAKHAFEKNKVRIRVHQNSPAFDQYSNLELWRPFVFDVMEKSIEGVTCRRKEFRYLMPMLLSKDKNEIEIPEAMLERIRGF